MNVLYFLMHYTLPVFGMDGDNTITLLRQILTRTPI